MVYHKHLCPTPIRILRRNFKKKKNDVLVRNTKFGSQTNTIKTPTLKFTNYVILDKFLTLFKPVTSPIK